MHNLEYRRLLQREKLDERRYLESLLETATRQGMIQGEFFTGVQQSLLELLESQSGRYNRGRSSSIRVETAQELLASLVFTISIWLKEIPEPEDALKALAETGTAEGYQLGREKLLKMVRSTRSFHALALRQGLETDNEVYNATLDAGISGFFKLYNPEFFAHRLHITADYPVFFYPEGYQGIEFIRLYLQRIQYETQFCRLFPKNVQQRTLAAYASRYGENTRNIVCNLYGVTLAAALACAAAECEITGLSLSAGGKRAVRRAVAEEAPLYPLLYQVEAALGGQQAFQGELGRYLERSCRENEADLKKMMLLLAE